MSTPSKCPSCNGLLSATELCCSDCKTTIKGSFELPFFALLSAEDEKFLKIFLSARGSIKEVERQLNISYPTVKARLDALIGKLGLGGPQAGAKKNRMAIIGRLERGEITAQETITQLEALDASPSEDGGDRPGRALHIRVCEGGTSEPKVNVSIPLGWAKSMTPFIESKIGAKLAEAGHILDTVKLQEAIEAQKPMKIVDVQNNESRIEIFIE
ncbi:MAG: DUF2089 domain-containing protein [Elusimicrobia bacterium]|nr:DUF2089 domain-containing protein [Elusimicrobiota bacterium]